MSTSKWVNRNIRSGHLPRPVAVGKPTYRKDYVRKVSSRAFRMGNRTASRNLRRAAANRIFGLGVVLVCVFTIAGAAIYSRIHNLRSTDQSSLWNKDRARLFAVDPGPDPIPHDPVEIVERFLKCNTRQALASICREDDNSQAILSERGDSILEWLENHREWTPSHEAKANGVIFSTFTVRHLSEPTRIIYVVQTPAGPKVDVGAFLSWSSENWQDLATGHVTRAAILRAVASRSEYYNYRFSDDKTWSCFRLDSLDGNDPLYGYARRGTNTAKALEMLIEPGRAFPVILSLDEGDRGSSHRQFRISRVLAAGWAMGPEIAEEFLPTTTQDPSLITPKVPVSSSLPSGQATEK